MINAQMRSYNFYAFGANDEYGQPTLSTEPIGTITMAINISTQSIVDNVNYKNATYIGLTRDAKVNDTYVIDYDGEQLKVLYINDKGRLKQVFLCEMQ